MTRGEQFCSFLEKLLPMGSFFSQIQDLRRALDLYLNHKVLHPSTTDWSSDSGTKEGDLLRAIIELLSCELEDMDPEPEYDDNDDE